MWAASASSGQPLWPHAHSPYSLRSLPLQSLPQTPSPGMEVSPTSHQQLFFWPVREYWGARWQHLVNLGMCSCKYKQIAGASIYTFEYITAPDHPPTTCDYSGMWCSKGVGGQSTAALPWHCKLSSNECLLSFFMGRAWCSSDKSNTWQDPGPYFGDPFGPALPRCYFQVIFLPWTLW